MSAFTKRWAAAIAIVGFAAAFVAVGVSLSHAQDAKAPDLANLREAVQTASKRGANVTEVAKALDALEKSLAKGFTPPKAGEAPPAELTALRDAVETAARKGEKVDAIRTELEAVEKAMVGKSLAPPKPLPTPDLPPRPNRPAPPINPLDVPFPQLDLPDFPGGGLGGVDRELMQKAQELRNKAFDMLRNNANDPAQAMQLMKEAQELMLKSMLNGRGGALMPDLGFPNPGVGRVPDRARLGIRMERLAPVTAEQLGLEGRGVAVTMVVPGSAADKAGIKVHDIILEFAGKPVTDVPEEFSKQVSDAKAGEKVDVVVLRKGKKVELKGVELPANPQPVPRIERRVPDGDQKPGLLPLPPRPIPAFPNPLGNLRLPADQNGRVNSVAVSEVNGQVTIKALQDGVNYVITGTKADDGLAVEKVTITDGDKKPVEVNGVKDVPKEYQAAVENLVKSVRPAKPRQRD